MLLNELGLLKGTGIRVTQEVPEAVLLPRQHCKPRRARRTQDLAPMPCVRCEVRLLHTSAVAEKACRAGGLRRCRTVPPLRCARAHGASGSSLQGCCYLFLESGGGKHSPALNCRVAATRQTSAAVLRGGIRSQMKWHRQVPALVDVSCGSHPTSAFCDASASYARLP